MKIGELSRLSGLSKDTIRFYEKIELLPSARRSDNGYRDYAHSIIPQLKLLGHAKELGFSLNEIKELSSLLMSDSLTLKDMNHYLTKKMSDIDDKIRQLHAFKEEIKNTLEGNCELKELLKEAINGNNS